MVPKIMMDLKIVTLDGSARARVALTAFRRVSSTCKKIFFFACDQLLERYDIKTGRSGTPTVSYVLRGCTNHRYAPVTRNHGYAHRSNTLEAAVGAVLWRAQRRYLDQVVVVESNDSFVQRHSVATVFVLYSILRTDRQLDDHTFKQLHTLPL